MENSKDASRDLFPGALEMMILESLRRQPAHGYALVQHIQQRSNNLLQVEEGLEGSLYPAPQRLPKAKLVRAEWTISSSTNRRVRIYQITKAGLHHLEREISSFDRNNIRVLVDGITAANDLGLTNVVPARITVLTDARLRPVSLGKLVINFRHAAPSRLYWAGRPAMRFVQALGWLRDLLPSDDGRPRRRLVSILRDPDHGKAIRDDLRVSFSALPESMRATVRDLLHDS